MSIFFRINNASFFGKGCDPEQYLLYQSHDTEKLVKLASDRIANDYARGVYQQAWEAGFILYLCFNAPDHLQ